jgi:hypothetical protein
MFKSLTPASHRCYFTTLFCEPLFLPETLEHKSILKLNIKRDVNTVQCVQYSSNVVYSILGMLSNIYTIRYLSFYH